MLKWSFGTWLEIIGARSPSTTLRVTTKMKGEKKYESTKAEKENLAEFAKQYLASGFLKQKRFTKEKVFNKKYNPFVFTKPDDY